MKYGLLVEKETRNIGDDIQAYAAKKFLPRIDYYVDRNHIDEFLPDKEEFVATILNGWFLQYTLNWPMSPFIKPLPISMHFTNKDWFWDTTDRAYHLLGYGLESLKKIEPIGCRDSHTKKLLEEKGIETFYSGCLTLTLDKYENVEKQDYICAVDVSKKVIEKIKKSTKLEVKEITHTVPENYYELSWEERFKNVENLLRTYQGAKAVVSYRLHCALPCIALETPVILLNEDYRNDRFGDYTKYINSCSEEDFVEGKVNFDLENLSKSAEEWRELRKNIEKRCNTFIKECDNNKEKYNGVSIRDYKEYSINRSNWLKEATRESYERYETEKKKNDGIKEEMNKTISDLKKLCSNNEEKANYYKKEFENAVEKLEKYKEENERIKNSRLWKLRNKIKGIN